MTTIEMHNFVSGHDPADGLPEKAATKYRALVQAADDAHAVLRLVTQQRLELASDRSTHLQRIKRLTDPLGRGGYNLRPDEYQVMTEQKKLDKAEAEIARLSEIEEIRSVRWRAASGPVHTLKSYLSDGVPQGCVLVDHEPPEVLLKKGESLLDAVERVRRRGRELSADLNRVRTAPHPSSVRRAAMREQVAALGAAAEPDTSRSIAIGGEVDFPTKRLRVDVVGVGVAFPDIPDTWAALAWLFPDAMVARLDALITEEADDESALTDVERQEREATILSDLLANDRIECSLIESARAQGTVVAHRPDISPLALLSVELITAPPHASPSFASSIITKMIG